MPDNKQSGAPGNKPGAGEAAHGRVAADEATGAVQGAGQAAARTASEAGQRGGEAVRQGGEAAATAMRQAGDAAGRGGEAMGEAARQGMQTAAQQQSRFVQGAAQEMEKTGRSLAGMVEEAAAGIRSLMGAPGLNPGGFQDAQQAVSKLVQGVMETNMRFADELLRRTGPSTVVDLQRQFLREYFEALAQGGTMLLRAARQAAEESLRPLEQQMRERGGAGGAEGGRQQNGAKVADVMSKDVKLASPEDTVQQAARVMSEQDTGVLPVGEDDRLVGMVTDRDIAVRAVAEGKGPDTKVREVMTPGVQYCFEDEDLDQVARRMAEQQVRRMPVMDRGKRLVGILSLGDVAMGEGPQPAGDALSGVSRPGGAHSQTGGERTGPGA
jgi:CBS domain-containing protein